MHGNNNVDDKNKTLTNRIIDIPANANRIQAFYILCCDEKDDTKEVKRQYMLLAQKYHPDECHNICDCYRVTGANVFKNISNTYELLLKR